MADTITDRAKSGTGPMRIGIDLGGTKIEVIALSQGGGMLARERCPTPIGDYRGTIGAISDLVGSVEAACGRGGTVGVGIPGAADPVTGLIKNANSVWLIGRPFEADLSHSLGRPVRVANDANCFILSEATDGAATGAPIAFGAILGTGVGGGIKVTGTPLTGVNAIAGEWGHNPLPWPAADERPGPDCYCGRSGCIETFLSGPGLVRDHGLRTGETREPEDIARRAAAGDGPATETLAVYADRLARALSSVINMIDPHVIVLGGGLSNLAYLYETVPGLWARHVFSDHVATRLVAPKFGDSSGVRGAAWLWPKEEGGMN